MKKTLKRDLLLSSLLTGAMVVPAVPAFAQDTSADEIVVTGSRISRPGVTSTSPVASIDAVDLQITNTVNSEEFLFALPQVSPAFGGTSNNPGTGTAEVDLRDLGTARTLVLVDGTRYISPFGNGVVDLNSIPSSLVKRIDVLTGGASAVYGSDAMAGVVNFVLVDDFEGVEVDASYQTSDRGDGAVKDLGVTMGGNFADGKGNAILHLGYTQRDDVFQGDRDFSAIANDDNGTGFDPFGSSGVPGTRLFDGFNFVNADPANCPEGTSVSSGVCRGGATFAPDGSIIPWINSGPNTTRYNYAPVNYLQLPQTRYTMFANATYDVTDTIEAEIRGVFTSNNVPQELAPTPFFNTVTIDIDNNPFLNAEARSILSATATAGGQPTNAYQVFIGRRMLEVGPRTNSQEIDSYQLSGNLSGQFNENWDWDIHAHTSRAHASVVQTGNVSISAMQAAVLSNECNIFGEGVFSQDCVDRVSRTGATQVTSQQNNLIATTTGTLNAVKSPMAEEPMDLVLGFEYREEDFDFLPDSVLGPDVSGFNQSLPIAGRYDTYDYFAEARLPLVQGAEFAEELSLNGAYRYSDYSTVGGVHSYAGGADWTPVSGFRIRGQYQRAVRAPNIGELFSPQTNGFPGADDPCADGTGMQSICVAQGVPAASFGDANLQPNTQIQGLFGGNPNLGAEKSDTFTVGFVAQPESIEGLTVAVDYYDISIDNAISTIPFQEILNNCYNGNVPAFCDLVTRFPDGRIQFVESTAQNIAAISTSGIDVDVNYTWDAADMGMGGLDGVFDLKVVGGYKISQESQALPITDVIDCVGFHDGRASLCGEPAPKWKHVATLRYSQGPALLSLRWRYQSSTTVDDELGGEDPNDLFVSETGAWNLFDLTGEWDVSDHLTLSGGILNAFDKQPPVLGDCCSEQANTFPSTFNPFGRQFYIGATARF